MSKGQMVVGPDLTPDRLKKFENVLGEITRQLVQGLHSPGKGVSLEEGQIFAEHRNPFELVTSKVGEVQPKIEQPKGPTAVLQAVVDNIVARLTERFGQEIQVDQLPTEFTDESLAEWAKFNLKPVFLPGEDIGRRRKLKGWKKPESWFYDRVDDGKIKPIWEDLPPTMLRRGWYLADFTVSADYTDGTQVFVDDPLASIIKKLREEKKIGKHDNTPLDSRFAIIWYEWCNPLLTYIASAYRVTRAQVRLERAIEFNTIGNLYDTNRGKFNSWEWFQDQFEGSGRLYGGSRDDGGLSYVRCSWQTNRDAVIAGRPLVSFVR